MFSSTARAMGGSDGDTERFVISTRPTGWGDCLVSAISAWQYARRTGRTLVIDWRHSLYLEDPQRNAFAACFEPVTRIGDVPVVSDDSVAERAYPSPIFESVGHRALRSLGSWLAERHLALDARQVETAYHRSHAEEWALLTHDEDRPEPTVMLRCSLSECLPDRELCQTFLAALVPRPAIRDEIDRFVRDELTSTPTVGVHVRYGSRAIADTITPYWLDEQQALDVICHGIARAVDEIGGTATVLLCTDRRQVQDAIIARVANVVVRDKYLRAGGRRELHATPQADARRVSIGHDALIEMFLLSRVDALVCYPPHSFFSFYARTCAGGPRVQILDARPCDTHVRMDAL